MTGLKWVLATVFVAGVAGIAGCNSNAGKEFADQTEALSKKMCDCADVACAAKVETEWNDFATKNKGAKGTKANVDRVNAATAKATECAKKLGDPAADKLDDNPPAVEE